MAYPVTKSRSKDAKGIEIFMLMLWFCVRALEMMGRRGIGAGEV